MFIILCFIEYYDYCVAFTFILHLVTRLEQLFLYHVDKSQHITIVMENKLNQSNFIIDVTNEIVVYKLISHWSDKEMVIMADFMIEKIKFDPDYW